VENFPLHNVVYIELIVTTQKNYSHGTIIIPISFVLKKLVVVDLYVDVPLRLTTIIPSDNRIVTKPIPLDIGCDPSKPIGGVALISMQCVIPYFRPYRKPFNYFEYKKMSYPDCHVQIFKAIIKINLCNFTLKDNASNWCNNYMRNHPNL
jgi:hypothetical protein